MTQQQPRNPILGKWQTPNGPIVSEKTLLVGGINATVYGLGEVNSTTDHVACLWLLHPRSCTLADMKPIARTMIHTWNTLVANSASAELHGKKGLIAVAIDQRNHGELQIDPLANEAWRQGNPTHAVDMFATFSGTARDVSHMIDHLPSYLYPRSEKTIVDHMVLGVSLGAHAAWHLLMHDPRIRIGVAMIGSPDYTNIMADRARLSKLMEWTSTDPHGSSFIGSRAYPRALVDAVAKVDPRAVLCGPWSVDDSGSLEMPATADDQALTQRLLEHHLGGKNILAVSGGGDKMIPYRTSKSFFSWLKSGTRAEGWYRGKPIAFEDFVADEAGHEVDLVMMAKVVDHLKSTIFPLLNQHPSVTAKL
ncbi:hypothetical protein M409DRAFT_22405 [Zasmidium cellare ATCC 36951]|uniref:AB hydrolase-1 domain-containing protein n=1 Tax=Zasmidium cellare ATCC 36951 TaxID=1080233 RepID=A0A6A6CLU5_ZASCE|nr:uncharacterized protein M409DRAFT_22405 [Zasmidium cellare ATCC 36951]KAF2167603.1 hypothetical protein M409DRAFT_22405 [Zasmidium cellare ATCC 36951]